MLRIENVSKRYLNGTLALEEADLHIEEGDFVTILGPSGAGKSTLLRIPQAGSCVLTAWN